ncbi:MAG: helix-turn-helix transcriptional regulator [Proteobacteria bacterium]|nr:helix-turn-helix transcriptional regulator [Pseudomonadota bacterium]
MLARTKTHHTDNGLVSLTLHVPKAFVPSIRKYAEELMDEPIPWRDSFNRHLADDSIAGVCLQSARTTKGLTQKQLADLTGIPQRHISEMEHSKRNIGKERAIRLANVLDTDYRLFL